MALNLAGKCISAHNGILAPPTAGDKVLEFGLYSVIFLSHDKASFWSPNRRFTPNAQVLDNELPIA